MATPPPCDPATASIVKTHMAHHQGMTLVAIANVLLGDVMVDRFHADRRIQATELLLQERIPRQAPIIEPRPAEETRAEPPALARAPRRLRSPHTPYPRAQILSNGSYVAIVTNGGGGTSFCRGRAVTRWREDRTRDPGSQFVYLRDVHTGAVWSAAYQPSRQGARQLPRGVPRREGEPSSGSTTTSQTRLEVAVSPGDDAEVRRVSLTNRSDRPREIELTSYVEAGSGARSPKMSPAPRSGSSSSRRSGSPRTRRSWRGGGRAPRTIRRSSRSTSSPSTGRRRRRSSGRPTGCASWGAGAAPTTRWPWTGARSRGRPARSSTRS